MKPMQVLRAYKYIWLELYEIIADELHSSLSLSSKITIAANKVHNTV